MMYCTHVHTQSYFERLSGKQTEQWNEWKNISHGRSHIVGPSKRLSARFHLWKLQDFRWDVPRSTVASDKTRLLLSFAFLALRHFADESTLNQQFLGNSITDLSMHQVVHLFLEKDDIQHQIRVVLVVDFSLHCIYSKIRTYFPSKGALSQFHWIFVECPQILKQPPLHIFILHLPFGIFGLSCFCGGIQPCASQWRRHTSTDTEM